MNDDQHIMEVYRLTDEMDQLPPSANRARREKIEQILALLEDETVPGASELRDVYTTEYNRLKNHPDRSMAWPTVVNTDDKGVESVDLFDLPDNSDPPETLSSLAIVYDNEVIDRHQDYVQRGVIRSQLVLTALQARDHALKEFRHLHGLPAAPKSVKYDFDVNRAFTWFQGAKRDLNQKRKDSGLRPLKGGETMTKFKALVTAGLKAIEDDRINPKPDIRDFSGRFLRAKPKK